LCGLCADDIVNQAKDSAAKFIVTSQKCASKSVGVRDTLPQQIKVLMLLGSTFMAFDLLNSSSDYISIHSKSGFSFTSQIEWPGGIYRRGLV